MAATLKLDGREYELPTFADLTMGEAATMEKYAEMTVAQIEALEGDVPIGALIGLAIVGIRRHRPEVSEREAAKAVEGIKLTEMRESFASGEDEEKDENPESASAESLDSDESQQASGVTSNSDSESPLSPDAASPDSGLPSSVTPADSTPAIS